MLIINIAKRFYDFLTFGRGRDVWWGRKKVVLLQFLFGRVMPGNDRKKTNNNK